MNGRGKYEYANPKGASYDGLWINGRREDNNATYICTQYKYTGSYKSDRQNGTAQIIFLTGNRAGDTFSGEIVNNKFAKGTYTYSEKNTQRKKYEGEFTNNNNKFNGQGTLYYKDGKEQKGQWKDDKFLGKQIGTLYNQPVYWDMLDTVTTSKEKYKISEQQMDSITKAVPTGKTYPASESGIAKSIKNYFYIKEGNFIRAVVEIHKSTNSEISPNTSSSYPVAKVDYSKNANTTNVILNTDEKLLNHLNRNQHNKPAKGVLTHIREELYYDENHCIWILFPEKHSIYHNPNGKYENLKFVRPVPNKSFSHETILTVDNSIIQKIKNKEYPATIEGTQVKSGDYQQTYNFEHSAFTTQQYENKWFGHNWINFFNHFTHDVELHNAGWKNYAKFPQNIYDETTTEEKLLLQNCSLEIRQLNEYAKNAPIGTAINTPRKSAITSIETVVTLINKTCDETLSEHLKEYPLNLFNLLANQTPTRQSPERTMNENIENAILRIMQHLPHESHINFFNLLEKDKNYLLKKLVLNMNDKIMRLIGNNNYTSFIKELIRIYNATPHYWLEKISEIEDEDLFGHIINLYPKPFKSDYKPSISTFGSIEPLNEYRFDAEYNKNTGKIIVYEKELLRSQTYAETVAGRILLINRKWVPRNESTLNLLDPIIILTNKELPIVETALQGGVISDNVYLVPAIFFKYKEQKELNQFLVDAGGVVIDVASIYLSGGTVLSTKIHWVVRVWALFDIAGNIGDIANITGTVKNEKVKQAIDIYNNFFLGLSVTAKLGTIPEFAKKIKNIIKDNNPLFRNIQRSFSSWLLIVNQLEKENITENERKILVEIYDNYLKLGVVNEEQASKIRQILEIAVSKENSNTSSFLTPNSNVNAVAISELTSSAKQNVTYDAPTLLTSTSGETYEAQAGYYFTGTLKDGKIEQGTLFDSNKKPVKTFFVKK
jgi:hypothetical protein